MSMELWIRRLVPGQPIVFLNDAIKYVPFSPRLNDSDVFIHGQDGQDQAAADLQNVWETYEGFLPAATAVETIRQLTIFFDMARHHSIERVGPPVFLFFKRNAAADEGRSELMGGRVFIDERTIVDNHGDHKNPRVRVRIVWKRKPWWDLEEVELPLTNRNGTAVTGGLAIGNHHDGTTDNFVTIADTAVEGGFPAAMRLQFKNTTAGTNRANRLYVGCMNRSNVFDFAHIIQGQSSALGSSVSDAGASGGAYRTQSWSGTSETILFRWEIPQATLNVASGRYYRILLWLFSALAGSVTDLEVQWRLRLGAASILSQTEWEPLPTGRKLVESASIQLPPRPLGDGLEGMNYYPLDLLLVARRLGGASTTLDVDFLQITPLDGYRSYRSLGFQIDTDVVLVDDGVANHLYTIDWSTSGAVSNYVANGPHIRLYPNHTNRLYFLVSGTTGDSISRTAEVQIYYRPRVLSL
jgi:hypothetical protein